MSINTSTLDLSKQVKKLGLAQLVTNSRNTKIPITHKKEVRSLRSISLESVANNFKMHCELKGLRNKTKFVVFRYIKAVDLRYD